MSKDHRGLLIVLGVLVVIFLIGPLLGGGMMGQGMMGPMTRRAYWGSTAGPGG